MATTTKAEIYRRPYLITITFAAALLLFLLPFFNITCNNVTMVQLSGVDMATGSRPSMGQDLERFQNQFGNVDTNVTVQKKPEGEGHLFITALLALALGAIGLVLSLVNRGRRQRPVMLVGVLGAAALLASWIEVSLFVKSQTKNDAAMDASPAFPGMINVSASPTFWYILSLLCFAVSAYYSYRQNQLQVLDEMPPKDAPQLNLGNPGDQSEFPAAPHEERDLG